jgi:hypothetical protein
MPCSPSHPWQISAIVWAPRVQVSAENNPSLGRDSCCIRGGAEWGQDRLGVSEGHSAAGKV